MSVNKKPRNKQFAFGLDPKLRRPLERLAKANTRSMTAEINLAIEDRITMQKAGVSLEDLLRTYKTSEAQRVSSALLEAALP